jgi:hypothetical protein
VNPVVDPVMRTAYEWSAISLSGLGSYAAIGSIGPSGSGTPVTTNRIGPPEPSPSRGCGALPLARSHKGVQELTHKAPIHANERDRTVAAGRRREPKSIEQETRKLLPIHLPHAHRKVAVAEASQAADIAIDLNITADRRKSDRRLRPPGSSA